MLKPHSGCFRSEGKPSVATAGTLSRPQEFSFASSSEGDLLSVLRRGIHQCQGDGGERGGGRCRGKGDGEGDEGERERRRRRERKENWVKRGTDEEEELGMGGIGRRMKRKDREEKGKWQGGEGDEEWVRDKKSKKREGKD